MSLSEIRFLLAVLAIYSAGLLPGPGSASAAAADAFATMRVEPVVPPRPVSHLVLRATDGTPIRLADFKGKVVVIGFLLTN
jgi:cytochrome oxidase Cu insertion factor (SCO1/SenC/PrrC family)